LFCLLASFFFFLSSFFFFLSSFFFLLVWFQDKWKLKLKCSFLVKIILEKGFISQKWANAKLMKISCVVFHVKVKIQMKNSSSSLLIKRQSKEGIVSVYNKILKKYPSSSLFVKRQNKEGVTPNILSVHFS
jgi:hypothetical protein